MVALIKALKSALFPPAINLFFIVIGLLLIKRFPKAGKACVVLSLLSLYVVSITPTSKLLLGTLEDIPALPRQVVSQGEQAIVVLGGGTRADAPEYDSDTVNSFSLERLRYAADIHKQTSLPLLVTGGRLHNEKLSEAELMQRALDNSFHVPTKWIESKAQNTAENAIYSAAMLKPEVISHIYLVTHAWHMKRAVAMFEQQGFTVTPAPTAYASQASRRSLFSQLIPESSAMSLSNWALHEYLGLLWYRLRYSET